MTARPFTALTRWSLLVFGLTAAVRIVVLVLQMRFGLFDIAFDAADSMLYRALAESLLADGRYAVDGSPTAYVTPGYPLFLAALFPLSRATWFIGTVQALVSGLAAVAVADVAQRAAGLRAGLLAGLAFALYPHLIFWNGYVLTETLYVALVVVAVWLADRAWTEQRVPLGGMAGLAFGLAALTRPIILGFALALGAAGLLAARYRRVALVGLAVLGLTMAPWVVRNALTLDAPIVTSSESGYVLWQGNSPGATGGTRGYVDGVDFEPLDLPAGLSGVEADRIYRQRALGWMADNPARVLALAPKKLWNMWRPTYEGSSALNQLVTLSTYPVLLGFGIAGIVLLVRRRDVLGWLVLGFVAYHLVVHGLVTGMIRFRLPVEAVLVIPASVAAAALLDRVGVRVGGRRGTRVRARR